ncbi:MAG: Crp/Fnr family transcriptional regulator, partial [Actinobacteria bacterium]|nr:Crp/Fnr family transcriptional regulator [Actinomycetota bacterium]
ESPELAAAVLHNMSAQLRRANDRLVARNSNSATVRTGNMLVELSSLMMKHSGCADRCELPITQVELADWIGATRESTARALACFRKAGLVETFRGKIVICDVLGLDQMIAAA